MARGRARAAPPAGAAEIPGFFRCGQVWLDSLWANSRYTHKPAPQGPAGVDSLPDSPYTPRSRDTCGQTCATFRIKIEVATIQAARASIL